MSARASRVVARVFTGLALLVVMTTGGAARADRPKIVPYIDVREFTQGAIKGSQDMVTYGEVVGGVGVDYRTRRVVSSLFYSYTRRIPQQGDIDRSGSHNGIARARIELIKDLAILDMGAIATYSRINPSGAAPLGGIGNAQNITQVYSFFVAPSIGKQFGELNVGLNYRYNYTTSGNSTKGVPITPGFNRFQDATVQSAGVSMGMKQGTLPFSWSLKSGYTREDSGLLHNRFEAYNSILEVVQPITATIALVASGGYESSKSSQDSTLVDPITGAPVLDANLRTQPDPASPRVLTYDTSGLVGDAGLIWTPSRRTHVEARAGYRYGGFTVSGLMELKPDRRSAMTLIVYDRLDSFARGVGGGLADLPAELAQPDTTPGTPYSNCLFGKQAGTGGCIGSALGSAAATNYRTRGVNFIYGYEMRRTRLSFGGGYSRRTYQDDPTLLVSLNGVVDQTIFAQGSVGRNLSPDSSIDFSFTGNLFINGQAGAADVQSLAWNSRYSRNLGRSLIASASVGVEASKQDGSPTDILGRAELGVRYSF
jgi:uncharacterized protein (PEP-CTERM system associated)